MSTFKEKAQVFVVGLAIGLLIAGAFFILKLDDYFKELNSHSSAKNQVQQVVETKSDDLAVSEKSQKNHSKSPKDKGLSSSLSESKNDNNADLTASSDTINHLTKDSIMDSFIAETDIVVRKDELLSTKTLEVLNLTPTANKLSPRDSMLQKVSNIKDDRLIAKQMFNIEFWQSPLNYKGYKMSKYKMVLYGIGSAEGLKVFKLDDAIYLKSASLVYRLDYASDFKPYERITDELILNKLK